MSWTLVIVDDEQPLRRLLRKLVERDGRFTVVGEAGDGARALELIEEHDPDLLLLDLGLPEVDGLQVLARLAGAERPRTVVLTGFDDGPTHRKAVQLGASCCLVKGRDFHEVVRSLSEAT